MFRGPRPDGYDPEKPDVPISGLGRGRGLQGPDPNSRYRSQSPATSDSNSYVSDTERGRISPPRYFNHGHRRPDRDGRFYTAEDGGVRRADSPEWDDDFLENELELPNKDNYDLATIPEPELTPAEQVLPRFLRELRVLLKKCQKVNCYNFIPVEKVIEAVKESSFPALLVEEEVNYLSGEGPHQFYLRWVVDKDKVELVSRWLTAEIMEEDIEESLHTDDVVDTMVSLEHELF